MKEVFEKIVEELETNKQNALEVEESIKEYNVWNDAIEIVKQVASEYGGGWIPCSERFPEDDSICIVTVEYPNNKTLVDYGWFDRKNVCWFVGMHEYRTSNILACQPFPHTYQTKGE